MKEIVFVYGTLQRGHHNHSVMQKSGGDFIGVGETVNRYPLTVSSLPFLHNFEGVGNHVLGEVYQVETLKWLDILESHPMFYKREVIEIALATYRMPCWTYFLNRDSRTSGDQFKEEEMHSSFSEARETLYH